MRRTLACVVAVVSLTAMAADPGPPPPPPPASPDELPPPPPPPPLEPAPSGEQCVPACREGYSCQNGQCVGRGDAPTNEPLPAGSTMVNDRGERAPPGQHWETRRKIGLLITGPILFGVGYSLAILQGISGLNSRAAQTYLFSFIPVVGPAISFVVNLTSGRYTGIGGPGSLFLDAVFTAATTALQATGLTLGLLGIPKRQVLVDDPGNRRYDRDDDRRDDDRPRNDKPPPIQWSLAPFAPGADVGVSLRIVH